MKKFIPTLLCLMLLLTCCSTASAQTTHSCLGKRPFSNFPYIVLPDGTYSSRWTLYNTDDYAYILRPDGTARITSYSGTASELTVPSTLDGYSVASIGGYTFSHCSTLTKLILPESVTFIGHNAFSYCPNLMSVTLPDALTFVGNDLFQDCNHLTEIIVSPNNSILATIDGVLFNKQTKTLLYYPYAFTETSYEIPQGIRSINDNAFYDCFKLKSIHIPDSVSSIGASAFLRCAHLTTINIPDSVSTINNCTFFGCSSLTSINIPDSVTSIDSRAFYYCKSLTSLNIPDSVTFIGENAFGYCPDLTLIVGQDSYAEKYAIENDIPFIYRKRTSSTDWLNN